MRHGVLTTAIVAAVLVAAGSAFGFSGEDLTDGNPWHHEDITRRALAGDEPRYEGAGFSPKAADSIAWHADYVDSYAYNPLWWLKGGDTRLDAVLVGRPEFAKLHFDDVFSTSGVLGTWERYAAGTLIGLYWASLRDASGDLTSGQNVLGASLHAVQDFYSHSNWIDGVDRRCQTFLQTEPEARAALSLSTGAYELAEAGAPHHHGAFSLSCSLLRGRAFDTGLGPLCSGLSPLQNLPSCETFRACSAAEGITFSVDERQNGTLLYLDPPGIAMDSTWMSRVQATNRGLLDADGNFLDGLDGHHFRQSQCQVILHAERGEVCSANADMLFAGAKDLAIRASTEWVQYLGGCWYRFVREADAAWHLGFWSESHGGNTAQITMTGKGALTATYGYYHLGLWGGSSVVSGGPNGMQGTWTYDNSGAEIWTRVTAHVDRVDWPGDAAADSAVSGSPVTVVSSYSGPGNDMHGNRPRFELQLLGEDLWGLHDFWMPRADGLEIASLDYICAPSEDGYATHSDYSVCLRQGGVLGVQLGFIVWSEARPGLQTLYFNDQEIPFNLVLEGYPQPAEPREVVFALQSCNVLAEIDPPQSPGLIFTRSAPFP